jgi:hypothetical protein
MKASAKKILIPPYSRKLKNPPYPEHVIEDWRERMNKGPVTLGKEELGRIIAMLEILSSRCGAAYQVLGEVASLANIFGDPEVVRVMDLLAFPLWEGSILPFDALAAQFFALPPAYFLPWRPVRK